MPGEEGRELRRWQDGELFLKSEARRNLPLLLLAQPSTILRTVTRVPLRQLEDRGALWSPVHRLRLVACSRRLAGRAGGTRTERYLSWLRAGPSCHIREAFSSLLCLRARSLGRESRDSQYLKRVVLNLQIGCVEILNVSQPLPHPWIDFSDGQLLP